MFSIIVAFDKNKVIGKDNKMPWHYPEDLKYFKEVTLGKTVVMGRNTYESILSTLKRPLPNRHNIVITTNVKYYPEVECYSSITAFLEKYNNSNEEIFIIGGRSIYEQFIDKVSRLYITHINKTFTGDTYFPDFNESSFNLIFEKPCGDLDFCIYERRV